MKLCFEYIDNTIKVSVMYGEQLICEYICLHQKKLNDNGLDLLKTTLLSWATLDFSVSNNLEIEISLFDFEEQYVLDHFEYCTKLYSKIYNYIPATISFKKKSMKYGCVNKNMADMFYLGYTEGKDSSLCKELINKTGKNIEYYKVSYDDDTPAIDGHIYCRIEDRDLYQKYTITGWKETSDIISFQQADDIHVTFACPFAYEKNVYPNKLAVGIPWDAIHTFSSGEPDIVPTETYQSILLFENLVHNYGYEGFKIISPIATLHTYGVYAALERLCGLEKLLNLDSCWESYAYLNRNCGFCPKCQRLKKVFKDCFNYDNNSMVPLLNIVNADFLFGSVYATKILEDYPPQTIMNTMFLDKCSTEMSGEFIEILKSLYDYKTVNDVLYEYTEDEQTWEGIMDEIVGVLGINYDSLSDDITNTNDVPFLPFEKYYKWKRKNKVLNCYSSVEMFTNNGKKRKRICEGDKLLCFPDTNIFKFYLMNTPFFK